jgi:hypothetical protein
MSLGKLKLFVSRTLGAVSAAHYHDFTRSPAACGS